MNDDVKKRIMALDVGDARIGMAVSDMLNITAQAMPTIERKKHTDVFEFIKDTVDELNIKTIVIGMPKNMDGSYGIQSEKVKKFTKRLKKIIDTDIEFWDERLTSVSAERVLNNFGNRDKKKAGKSAKIKRNNKGIIDQMAAQIILKGYMQKASMKK